MNLLILKDKFIFFKNYSRLWNGEQFMIKLTKLNGDEFYLNIYQIEKNRMSARHHNNYDERSCIYS